MKRKHLIPIITLLLVGAIGSCKKDSNNDSPSGLSLSDNPNILSYDISSDRIPYYVQPLAPVILGVAGNFVILSKSGITDVDNSTIIGDIGSSPITGAAIQVSCLDISGTVYTVDHEGPFPCSETSPILLTEAISDMQAAYTDASNRKNPCFLELSKGDIGGLILTPGLYKWTTGIIIPMDITISGGADDIWIFQINGTLTLNAHVKIFLEDDAQAKNIYWVTAGSVTLEPNSHFEGIILGKTSIKMKTGSTLNGRILTETEVTLQMSAIEIP